MTEAEPRKRKHWPLWKQLLVAMLSAMLLATLAADWSQRWLATSYLKHKVAERNQQAISLLSASTLEALIVEDGPVLETIVSQSVASLPHIHEVTIRNEDGIQLTKWTNGDEVADTHLLSFQEEFVFEGELFGSLEVIWDLSQQYVEIEEHVGHTRLLVSGIVFVLTMVILAIVHMLAVRHINRINERILGLAEGDLATKISVSASQELVHLADSVNALAGVLQLNEQRKDELRLSASVFEGTSDAIIVTDSVGTIIQVNKGFTEVTGYPAEEVLGKTPSLLRSDRHTDKFYQEMWSSLEYYGRWQGEIWNRHKDGQVHPIWQNITAVKDDSGQVKQYIGVFSDITEKKMSEERIRYLAHYDVLTDLPNRLLFEEHCRHALDRANRDGHQLAVLFLDLDNFKNINDSLGHAIGDMLLKLVAGRLSSLLREEDTVARLGGDEFTVILEEPRGLADVNLVVRKLMNAFIEPFELEGQELRVTPSLGISIYPDDGEDFSTLIKNADAAMYRAKEQGRNNYQFYTQELTAQALERSILTTQLGRALEQDELKLYYQPQLSLKSGEVIGVEALLRWDHPEHGLVLPKKFIYLAEESGLIIPIGEWVIQTACHDFMRWREMEPPLLQVSVNVSGPQIQRGEIVETVRRVLEETGIEPHCLELEITESFIMREADQAIITLTKLKALGVMLAIDDFGTGYSSLSYLKRLPIDRLKIDRSFVRDIPQDPDDMAITKAILSLGANLQLEVIAEGVETKEQQEFLYNEGCEKAQGILYSQALPGHELVKLLEKGSSFDTFSKAHGQ